MARRFFVLSLAITFALGARFAAADSSTVTVVPGQDSTTSFAARPDTLFVEYEMTLAPGTEGFAGLASHEVSTSSDCAVACRFTRDGFVEASGSRPFLSETRVPYAAGSPLRLRLEVRVAAGRYSAFYASGGTAFTPMGLNLPLRSRLGSILGRPTRGLDRVVFHVDSGTARVSNLTVTRFPERIVKSIWAVHDGEKIERDDLQSAFRNGNSAWDGEKVIIFGARNEVVAFQLIVEAGTAGLGELSVHAGSLRRRGGTSEIRYVPPSADPSNSAGRPIQVYSENYMNVASPTTASWIYRPNSPSAPADPTGWKPVQLVPENAMRGRGGFPLSVAATRNQAFWIDVWIDRDLEAGVYDGTVRVVADGWPIDIPVELEVLNFSLPDENSMHAMVYYESGQPQLYHGRNLDAEYHRFAHRQRIELVNAYSVAAATAAAARFNGQAFVRDAGYEGPGEGVGNRILPASFYGPGSGWNDRVGAWAKSDEFMSFLARFLPGAITFLYMTDEPGPAEYPAIWQIADNIHSNPGPGAGLPIFVTHSYAAALDGAIDIWCSPPEGFEINRVRQERARSRRYWVYNGGRPNAPAIVIDSPATDPRAMIWACFKHEIDVYFYWHGVHWQHNSQMRTGDRNQNVWVNPVTFNNGSEYANGDGVLIYPGEEKLHPEQDRGVPGPCSTIQLANFRRGLQDHQYLTLARRLGLHAEVAEALGALVPRVFSEATSITGFSETGDTFEAARLRLGRAIATAGTANGQ